MFRKTTILKRLFEEKLVHQILLQIKKIKRRSLSLLLHIMSVLFVVGILASYLLAAKISEYFKVIRGNQRSD